MLDADRRCRSSNKILHCAATPRLLRCAAKTSHTIARRRSGTFFQLPALRRADLDGPGPIDPSSNLHRGLRSLLQTDRNHLFIARRRPRPLRRQSSGVNASRNRKAGRRARPACIQRLAAGGTGNPSESLGSVALHGRRRPHVRCKFRCANRGRVRGSAASRTRRRAAPTTIANATAEVSSLAPSPRACDAFCPWC